MIVHAWIGPRDPNTENPLPTREISKEGDTYEDAKAQIFAAIDPTTERVLNLR